MERVGWSFVAVLFEEAGEGFVLWSNGVEAVMIVGRITVSSSGSGIDLQMT